MKTLNSITMLLALLTVLMGCKKETKITECTFSYAPWAACDNGIQTRMGTANSSGCSTPPSDSLKKNCPTTITDLDGNSYGIKLIGNQTWTTKNLNVSKYRTGDLIPQVQDPTLWDNLTTGAWCYYENSSANGTIYGKLYNWYAVTDSRGLAPTGYHIPNNSEFMTLINYLGGVLVAGGKMKEPGLSHWLAPNTEATNSSGFSALPGGGRVFQGVFAGIQNDGTFWSRSTYLEPVPFDGFNCIGTYYDDEFIAPNGFDEQTGISVRCVKD